MILIENLIKNYGQPPTITPVLRGIDLAVPRGEFLAIMGKSGAGKSTLLYQMSLLDTPTSGHIMIDEVHTHDMTDNERTAFRLARLGYIFQDYALLPELSAVENVMLPLLMRGTSRPAAEAKAILALNAVGLGHRHTNRPSQLSGGEQQRVSIARAVAPAPDILFADEPTANLDTSSSEAVIGVMSELHRERGQTIVMVTHEREYAEFADRIIHLEDGQIIREEILKKSKN